MLLLVEEKAECYFKHIRNNEKCNVSIGNLDTLRRIEYNPLQGFTLGYLPGKNDVIFPVS